MGAGEHERASAVPADWSQDRRCPSRLRSVDKLPRLGHYPTRKTFGVRIPHPAHLHKRRGPKGFRAMFHLGLGKASVI